MAPTSQIIPIGNLLGTDISADWSASPDGDLLLVVGTNCLDQDMVTGLFEPRTLPPTLDNCGPPYGRTVGTPFLSSVDAAATATTQTALIALTQQDLINSEWRIKSNPPPVVTFQALVEPNEFQQNISYELLDYRHPNSTVDTTPRLPYSPGQAIPDLYTVLNQ